MKRNVIGFLEHPGKAGTSKVLERGFLWFIVLKWEK